MFELKDSIPESVHSPKYEIANEIEKHPLCWVDKITDEFIEVHSNTDDKKAFYDALHNILKNSKLSGEAEIRTEKLIINGEEKEYPYCFLNGRLSC